MDKPILYKSAMLCIKLHVVYLGMKTATFTWTGTGDRMLVSCLSMTDARVKYKNSNVETSIRIRPLNTLALNDPSKFRSKKPGCCNPLSWAHKRWGLLARASTKPCTAIDMQHICCQYHIEITATSLSKLSIVQYSANYKKKNHEPLCFDVHSGSHYT
jgi:hypothetical protein